jgi:DNA polymerase III psi subunit
MEPKWLAPCQVTSRDCNSYKLETLEGLPIGNRFSFWRLQRFIPCSGTALHKVQAEIEKLQGKQEAKEDIMQRVEERQVINDDSSTEWEDIEHGAEHEPSTLS